MQEYLSSSHKISDIFYTILVIIIIIIITY